MVNGTCIFPGCEKPVSRLKLCNGHYTQQYDGKPLTPLRDRSLSAEQRFWLKVDKSGPCWEWTGARVALGYGRFNVDSKFRRSFPAHRYSYELTYGPVPDHLVLDHLCRNPPCVNPEHLDPVTNKVNILRGVGFSALNANKTHCIRGHEFTPENTRTSRNGWRDCRLCGKEKSQSWRDARKQQ